MGCVTLAKSLPPVGSSVCVCKMKSWIGQSLKFLPGFMLGDWRQVCGQRGSKQVSVSWEPVATGPLAPGWQTSSATGNHARHSGSGELWGQLLVMVS